MEMNITVRNALMRVHHALITIHVQCARGDLLVQNVSTTVQRVTVKYAINTTVHVVGDA